MRFLWEFGIALCLLCPAALGAAGDATPAGSQKAPPAGIGEISFSEAKIATLFKEKIDSLKAGGLFGGLQFLVAGSTIAIVGEAAAISRDIETLRHLARLFEKGVSSPDTILSSAEVVMSDAKSATQLRQKLESFKVPKGSPPTALGLFSGLEFLPSGNLLLVMGDEPSVRRNISTVRRIAYFFERPRAHLQLNLRVVQISGHNKSEVTQMAEAVRDMVESQRSEIVRTFGMLQRYIDLHPVNYPDSRTPAALLAASISTLLPPHSGEARSMTLPEMLVRISLTRMANREADRASVNRLARHPKDSENEITRSRANGDIADLSLVSFAALNSKERDPRVENDDLLTFPAQLKNALRSADLDEVTIVEIQDEMKQWKARVGGVLEELASFATRVEREGRDSTSVVRLVNALEEPQCNLPVWIKTSLSRSVDSSARSFPAVVRDHAMRTLREISRRYRFVDSRGAELSDRLRRTLEGYRKATNEEARDLAESEVRQVLTEVRSLAEDLVPPPLALFQDIDSALDTFAIPSDQLAVMFREYAEERMKLENQSGEEPINYAKLQSLESRLNRWLRRISEVTGRSLEDQFYQKYVKGIRLLADKRLDSHRILAAATVDRVPDVTRDMLLAQRTVNVFISNSISLQFAPDVQNSVSATVQAALPSHTNMSERLAAAKQASEQVEAVKATLTDLNPVPILESLLAGGVPTQVKGGLTLQATPSVGYDAGSVTLTLSVTQTLDPAASGNVTDRVSRHEVTNSTINALSYEPMVLSTLTSDITYYDEVGGIPGIRKTPLIGKILNDLPGPLRRHKRQQGIFQGSVIILEPVVIPTIEDLINDYRGWRKQEAGR